MILRIKKGIPGRFNSVRDFLFRASEQTIDIRKKGDGRDEEMENEAIFGNYLFNFCCNGG